MNMQPPEKQVLLTDRTLDVHSIFPTIQGEGPFSGRPATFIRLAGCNLQCPMCDTEYTSGRKRMDRIEILRVVDRIGAPNKLVVISGGEPFRQQIGPLVDVLADEGYRIQIETNGTLFVEGFPYARATIVCSPKTGKVARRLIPFITAWKYVMEWGDRQPDGLPKLALGHPASPQLARPPKYTKHADIYVQPADHKDETLNSMNQQEVLRTCLENGYTYSMQQHKLLNLE